MRKLASGFVMVFVVASAAFVLTNPGGAASVPPPHSAAYVGPGDEVADVRCGSKGPFEVHGLFQAVGTDVPLRVEFSPEGDFLDFTIAAGETISFTQAAGSRPSTFDGKIIVHEPDPGDGEIFGWLSASRHGGTAKVQCKVTPLP